MLPLLRFLLSAFHLWEACATGHNDRCIRSTAKILIMLDLNHHFMPCDAIWSITQEKQGCQRQIFFKISSTNLPGFLHWYTHHYTLLHICNNVASWYHFCKSLSILQPLELYPSLKAIAKDHQAFQCLRCPQNHYIFCLLR